jgi:hypothetical protein
MTPSLPEAVKQTSVFSRLSSRTDLISTIESIRAVAEALGKQIERLLPEYTDHSVRHMDALWRVTDVVLTTAELELCTLDELFLLACAFYVHDLGMAAACTKEGIERLRSSPQYKIALLDFQRDPEIKPERADILAIRAASRELHAELAPSLVLDPIPGLDRYLINDPDAREVWGALIGELAASHHWTLQQLEKRLGRRGAVPTADGGSADLAYVGSVLRISDYAHINRERALQLERRLRSEISKDSSLHWDAQANVTGPNRDGLQLVYGCTAAITSIDAWWVFYDMASGLDLEIRSVREYLEGRKPSMGRFSLLGVRGAESPETFVSYVLLNSDVSPIDIRIQPNSMEKVIDLLGGPALYRDDSLAPLRELIQNCRDAIALRNAMEVVGKTDMTRGRIDISLDLKTSPSILRVRDNGIGMTRSIVRNHLISVGSDFWRSVEFARDFSRAAEGGFEPIGRFGIGFLSVFMLGNNVEVETERAGHDRILLRLRGVGRRGEIIEKLPTGRIGTEIRVQLTQTAAEKLRDLAEITRARAPMLPFPIWIEINSEEGLV